MKLKDLVLQEARPMPVFLLIDTSGSMGGEKIAAVNAALRDMLSAFRDLDDVRGQIHISMITFGRQVNQLLPLTPVEQVILPELTAAGNTPMGQAIDLAKALIEDKDVVSSRAYTATIVLISDGSPTDIVLADPLYEKLVDGTAIEEDFLKWEPIRSLHESPRARKCVRLALGIGDNAERGMLRAFVNDPSKPVIRSSEATIVSRFFHWVTMSVSARSVSSNPDVAIDTSYEDLFDPNELL